MYIYIFVSLGCVWVYIMLNCPFNILDASLEFEKGIVYYAAFGCLVCHILDCNYLILICLLFRENWNSSC